MKLSPRYVVEYKEQGFKHYYNKFFVFHCYHFRDNLNEIEMLNN